MLTIEPEPRKPGRRPRAGGPLKTILSLRGTQAFRFWLDSYAISKGIDTSVAIERALALAAERDGFAPPPPRT